MSAKVRDYDYWYLRQLFVINCYCNIANLESAVVVALTAEYVID